LFAYPLTVSPAVSSILIATPQLFSPISLFILSIVYSVGYL
jgi:hypothetical protein